MRIPILTYHASHVSGNTYASNDRLALEADIGRITARGFTIWPLHKVIAAWLDDPARLEGLRIVALTCDDGTDFDFHDLPHPAFGTQRSVLNVLRQFHAAHPGEQPLLNITSFVVASPEARTELDKSCLVGRGWWNDGWWADAAASGLMDIANHSWDHHHETVSAAIKSGGRRGTFRDIATEALADYEIRQAAAYLASKAPNRGNELFAYPYGETNAYLVSEYFPRHARDLGIIAALAGRGGYLSERTNRWAVPRFIFRHDWSSADGLDRILERSEARD
jgi:peptidoglycan/xylan/chitin deacetylase (PgdA/CDA1 family)